MSRRLKTSKDSTYSWSHSLPHSIDEAIGSRMIDCRLWPIGGVEQQLRRWRHSANAEQRLQIGARQGMAANEIDECVEFQLVFDEDHHVLAIPVARISGQFAQSVDNT
jgi:hypothetical protein